MNCVFGQARGFDISNILVFAIDQKNVKDLVESIGLTAYFDKRVRTFDMI
jgi:hypothetical protein